ncbi:MAG: CocE/NonD family hydrolase [Rhodobacteraceae bacterium]|nr:CocE/NonD family hydrolase [Paracoccaceae bacterium]
MTIRTEFPHPVSVTENLFIPLPDGTRLAAKLWRPEGAGPVPAILEYLPYRKHDGTRIRDGHTHPYLAGHGYACIRVDIRGTGESEGIITDEYTEVEQQDGCDVIAWIAQQGWCDGQVAMIGISWGGFTGLQIAARQPPALKTVISVGSTDDRYATDVHYVGGCLSKDNVDWSSTMFAHNDLPPDPAIVGAAWHEMWMQRMQGNTPWILPWLTHQRRDAYWKHGSVCEDFSRITVPVYSVSGWADNYSEAVPRLLAGLKVPCRGLVGPWAHSYPYNVTVAPAIGWLQEVLRWCDHWMKGRETGIMDEPLYRVWMQEPVSPQTCYTDRPGRWVGEDQWPSPRIDMQQHVLNAGGRLARQAAAVEAVAICSPLWVGLGAGEVGRYGDQADWATDQREDDGGSLVFLSEPLTERMEILGAPLVHLRFASDKPLALVSARLNDVAPDGASTRVGIGLLNLTHRNSHEFPEPLTPGKLTDAVVEMEDTAYAFPPGHRIAVSLSTTYWPIAWPSPELATLTIRTGESFLTLPVRPPRAEDAALRPFDPPEHAPPTPHAYADMPGTARRQVVRDLLTGRSTVDFPRWSGVTDMPDIGHIHRGLGLSRYEITEGDPLSATTTTRFQVQIERGGTTTEHLSEGRLTCDATHFRVEMEVTGRENGQVVFTRRWDERIPRDHV